MHINTNQKAYRQNVDPSEFSCGTKGVNKPYIFQVHKFASKKEDFLKLKNYFNSVEDEITSKSCQNTPIDSKLKAEHNQLVATNLQAKSEDRSITSQGPCVTQDISGGSLVYCCSPHSLPRLVSSESSNISCSDPLSVKNINYCFQNNTRNTNSKINEANKVCCSCNQVNLFKFLKTYKNSYNSAEYSDISYFSCLDKCKESKDNIKLKREHQEIHTSDLGLCTIERQAIKRIEIIDSRIKKHNIDKLNLTSIDNSVNDSTVSNFGSHVSNQQNHLRSISNTVSEQDGIPVKQPVPGRPYKDSSVQIFTSSESSFESCNGFKKNSDASLIFDTPASKEKMEDTLKQAIEIFIKNKLGSPNLKIEIFESYGENENRVNVDEVYEESFNDKDEYVLLPSMHGQKFALREDTFHGNTYDDSPRNLNFEKNKRNRFISDLPKKSEPNRRSNVIPGKGPSDILSSIKFLTKHASDKNNSVNSNNLSNTKLKHAVGNKNSNSSAVGVRDTITTTATSPSARKDDNTLSLNDDNERFSVNLSRVDPSSTTKKVSNSNDEAKKKGSYLNIADILATIKVLVKYAENKILNDSDTITKNNLVNTKFKHAVGNGRFGFPLKDLKDRKLKNIRETELLPIRCIEQLKSPQLQDYASFKHEDFNLVNGIYFKQYEIQIVDKNNVPTHLYNSLGYPLNDENGVLLTDSNGNLKVILDRSGSPLCCRNSDFIYLKDGTSWLDVKNYYNIFYNGKNSKIQLVNNNNCYNVNDDQSCQVPVTKKFHNLEQYNENQIETNKVSLLNYSKPSTIMELSSGIKDDSLSEVNYEIQLSQEINDYHTAVLREQWME